jgi:hypothetical protein
MSEPPQPPPPPQQPSGEPYYPPQQPWGPPGGYAPNPNPDPYAQGGYQHGGYQQGGYQQGGYQQGGYPPPGPSGGLNLAQRLGSRLLRRPEPRFGISLAAAGVALAVVGVLYWSFGYLIQGLNIGIDDNTGRLRTDGESRRFLGFALSLLLTAAGYALMIIKRRGPLATAGAIGAAIGVPLALVFVTLDFTGLSGGLPINIDLVYMLSAIIWLITYFVVPGARGRAFFLAIAALAFASYVEYKVASDSFTRLAVSAVGSSSPSLNDIGTGSITAVALIFGIGYYAIAVLLDRKGYAGAAVALVVAGFFSTTSGITYGVLTFKQVGTGVELLILGVALSWYGGHYGRRFTTWFWAFAIVAGIGLIVQKALPDSPSGGGITFIVIGVVVVVVAQLVATATGEPTDLEAVPTAESAGQQR